MMIEIFITIHALSTWNEKGWTQGHCDTHLSRTGQKMADLLAARDDLTIVKSIYTSDLARAFETAKPLADRLGLPIQTHEDLREGRWVGCHDDASVPLLPFHCESETKADVKTRAERIMYSIAEATDESPVLIVTHGAFLRLFLHSIDPVSAAGYKGIRTSLNHLQFNKGKWNVVSLNDDIHLNELRKSSPVDIDNG